MLGSRSWQGGWGGHRFQSFLGGLGLVGFLGLWAGKGSGGGGDALMEF